MRASLVALLVILSMQPSLASAGFCRDLLNARQPTFSREYLEKNQFYHRDFPEIKPEELSHIVIGSPSDRHFVARYHDVPVIAKKLVGSLKEAAWLQELNKLGIGVQFYGLVRIEAQVYFVMERVSGFNTNVPNFGGALSKPTLKEIERQFDILVANGIYPVDLQFQISHDGKRVKLVDPELFQMRALSKEQIEMQRRLLRMVLSTNFDF